MAVRVNGASYIDTIDCEYQRFANPEYDCY